MFMTVLHPIVLMYNRIFFYYIDDGHLGFHLHILAIVNSAAISIWYKFFFFFLNTWFFFNFGGYI